MLAHEVLKRGFVERVFGIDMMMGKLSDSRRRLVGMDSAFVPIISLGDTLPFARASFNTVICINTLHNQPSWAEVRPMVGAMCDVAGPHGSIIFDIRNARDPLISLAYRFAKTIDPSTKRLPVKAYPLFWVKELLEVYGFRIERKIRVRYPFWFVPSAYVIEAKR